MYIKRKTVSKLLIPTRKPVRLIVTFIINDYTYSYKYRILIEICFYLELNYFDQKLCSITSVQNYTENGREYPKILLVNSILIFTTHT